MPPVSLSQRTAISPETNALARALAARRARGERVIDLTVANPTRAGLPYDHDTIRGAFLDARALDHEPAPFGLHEAREAVTKDPSILGVPVDPSRVILTASTSEAYAFLFKVLCDPGDGVLVPQPSYPLFEHLARFEAIELVPYRLAYDGAWHVDLDSVRRAIATRDGGHPVRAILTVSPNNPTGTYVKRDELAALTSFGLPLVSDEVFGEYALRDDPRRARTALEASDALVIALGGLSKAAALPQMKGAWTAIGGPAREVRALMDRLELVADSFLSVGAPVQWALPRLLASRRTTFEAIRARTRANLDGLRGALGKGSPATVLDVEGGWYATLRVPAVLDEEAWVLDLLERAGVYAHPGHFFDFAGEAYVVLSLLTPPEDFAEGVARLLARVTHHAG